MDISLFIPSSDKYHALEDFKQIKGWRRAITIAVTIIASLGLGFCGVAAFRSLVGRFKPVLNDETTETQTKTEEVANKVFGDGKIPPEVKASLEQIGISLNDLTEPTLYHDRASFLEKMDLPIMLGHDIFNAPFIALKIRSAGPEGLAEYFELDDEALKLEYIEQFRTEIFMVFLSQEHSNSLPKQWNEQGTQETIPCFFNFNTITDSETGSLVEGVEECIPEFQKLIRGEVARDLRGNVWKLHTT